MHAFIFAILLYPLARLQFPSDLYPRATSDFTLDDEVY